MIGKSICKYLKSVRRAVAEANGIDLEIPECTFDGECSGTCPRCEAEVRMLEQELSTRQRMAQKVAVLGVAAGLSLIGMPNAAAQNITPSPTQVSETHGIDSVEYSIKGYVPPVFDNNDSIHCITIGCIAVHNNYIRLIEKNNKIPLLKSTHEVEDIIHEATFPGGKDALDEYIAKHLTYPEEAAEKGISGAVKVEFKVGADGNISNVTAAKKVHPLLDAEAERLVASMPPWNPTIVNGRKAAYYYEITIQFLPQ